MAEDELDEDTKLALLASLLEPATFSSEEYGAALADAGGDIQVAAERLLLPRVRSIGKRKAGTSLEGWLGRKRGNGAAPTPRPQTPEEARTPPPASEQVEQTKSKEDDPPKPKPGTDAFKLLLDSSAKSQVLPKVKAAPQPPIRLYTQSQIDAHNLPLTLLTCPLSPSLASALYLALMEESETWDRNRWYLAGRWVESPHTATVYCREGDGYGDVIISKQGDRERKVNGNGSARYFYTGAELGQPPDYPPLLKEAAALIEPVVNASLKARSRYAGEWAGNWRANVCGANRYDGASSGVGWHADQLTYLGPYATIASLSLGTPRAFRLRPTDPVDASFSSGKPTRTYEVTLGHNSLVLMNAGCQERYKHTVPPQKALDLFRPGWSIEQEPVSTEEQKTYTSRINITFRFYREDFHPNPGTGPCGPRQGTPSCKCGIPTSLRADQKAKARSKLGSPSKRGRPDAPDTSGGKAEKGEAKVSLVDDDMIFFWQCQSPGQTGELKGCGFFKILDMKAEGRGPCMGDVT